MSFARKVDTNHGLIKKAFEKMGCSTMGLFRVGNNVPDILVGVCGVDQLVEVKSGEGKPTSGQVKFHGDWRGRKIAVVRTVAEAALVVGWMGETARAAAKVEQQRLSGGVRFGNYISPLGFTGGELTKDEDG